MLRGKLFWGRSDLGEKLIRIWGETGLRGKKGEEADSEEKNWFKGGNDYGERLI